MVGSETASVASNSAWNTLVNPEKPVIALKQFAGFPFFPGWKVYSKISREARLRVVQSVGNGQNSQGILSRMLVWAEDFAVQHSYSPSQTSLHATAF